MTGNDSIRIMKVISEFNIGMGTLVEFLGKKGIKIEASPRTKLSPEAYALVKKEFGKEQIIKEQSKKVAIKIKEITNKDHKHKSDTEEEFVPNEEVFIKNNNPSKPIIKKEVSPKSDIEEPTKPVENVVSPPTPKAETLKTPEVVKPIAEKPKENEKPKVSVETKKVEKPKVIEEPQKDKALNKEVSKPNFSNKAELTSETKKEIKPASDNSVSDKKPVEVKKTEADKSNSEIKKEDKDTKEKISTDTIKKNVDNTFLKQDKSDSVKKDDAPKSHIKVLGKIDLEKNKKNQGMQQKGQKKPKNSPIKQNNKIDRLDKKSPKKEEVKKEKKEERPVIEHIDTKVEKLAGPKTLGTIDLSQFAKKPSQKNKGKRERIHKNQKEKVDINSKDFKKTSANKSGANKNSGGRPNNGHNGQNNNNNSSRRPNNNNNTNNRHQNSRHKGKFTKQPFKAVIDEDQIQKQIKETYARMTEGKGKTKGSKHRREKRDQYTQKINKEHEIEQQTSNVLKVTEFVTVNELAILMDNTPVTKVIEACMNLGLMVSINQRLDAEALVIVAEEFGYKVEFVGVEEEEIIDDEKDDSKDLISRPPIVTVMGHVDHGKTSLLDHIRKTNVIAGEAGGITQHIGAYNVKLASGQKITFLDTPGHEAFTAMRARGAKITDLAIIIIAADDTAKLMPQTVEAINHARAAGVPMVFAINKIDKPGANPEIIKEFLSKMDILVEEWGGKYQCQEISAKKGINISELLDKVLLEAEFLDLKANPKRLAKGSVIESALDKGRGYTATILVQNGTLRVGDMLLSGSNYGRVKAMFNERGQKVKEAGPSTPVTVLGLNGAPTAGETFNVLNDEKEVKDIAAKREQLLRIQGLRTQKHITLEEIGRRIAIGNFQELNIIVKGDVDGSIEALSDSLIKLSNEEIHVNVIHKAVGAISESDVLLATASNAIIIGFQVRPDQNARRMAEKEEIDIRLYSVIYDAINEVKSGIEGMLAPEEKEEVTANAEVKEIFKITKVGTIAGCIVTSGKLTRTSKVRVIRDGIVVYTGELGSLKRFKDDVKEVITGQDCGLNIANFNDIKVNDIVEAYNIVKIKRTL